MANAMRRAVDSLSTKHDQWKGKFYICSPCYQGCHVVSADPPMSDATTFGTLDGDTLAVQLDDDWHVSRGPSTLR